MIQFLFWILQKAEESSAYNAGHELGFFIGKHILIIISIILVLVAVAVLLIIKSRRKSFNHE